MALQREELEALVALLQVPGIGSARVRALVSHFKSVHAVAAAPLAALCDVPGIDRTLAHAIKACEAHEFARRQLDLAQQRGCALITFWDDEYPALLKKISDPPVLFYLKGGLQAADQNAIAVVGTRAPTQYGKMATEKIVADLVARGITIVSGLARGVDTTAHHAVVRSGGRTLAVLGSGLDVVYPAENRNLLEDIARNGAVISEFPFGAKPDAMNFPRRNRIISGLSLGVIVIEAGRESGALITANFALDQNREVFAVPGSIFSPKSAGPHQLLKEGAKLIQNADDILEELNSQLELFSPRSAAPDRSLTLEQDSRSVYDLISHEPSHIDALSRKVRLPAPQLMAILLDLELQGIIKQLPGKFFVRN